jgi:hypothetical protein
MKEALGVTSEMSTSSAHATCRVGIANPYTTEVPGEVLLSTYFNEKSTAENPTAHVSNPARYTPAETRKEEPW